MSGRRSKHFTTVAVGTPPTGYSYDEAVEACVKVHFHFHGFASLPTGEGEDVESPVFECFGRNWTLDLYPGGVEESDDGMVAVFLCHCSNGTVHLGIGLSVQDLDGNEIKNWPLAQNLFGCYEEGINNCWGEDSFAERSRLIDGALIEGTLVIEVRMKLIEATGGHVPQFIPENPLCKNILKKFMDEESADVLFEVESESEQNDEADCKKANASTACFHAHYLILQDCSSTLADLCKSTKTLSPIQIAGVQPGVFRHMLYYMYGGKVAFDELKANAKDIIDAADKYGVENLKLEAEACYARTITLTVDNVIDILVYAESKNCALLKEVVMDFIVGNMDDIIGNVSFESLPSSMMMDLLTAMNRGKKQDEDSSDANNYNTMRVSTLRRKLYQKGLDVDGSREAMIAVLKEN
ncbi:hypothetical protein ACHAXR_008059 [Thalassiosira sp. AJA248-18]